MIQKILKASALSCALLLSGAALAKDTSKTVLYPVAGGTAKEVYEFIKRRAPRVKPGATFAVTLIATRTEKREAKAGSSCRYNRFRTAAIYTFYVPRHAQPKALPQPTRAKWAAFESYLLRHEQGHRTIWRECLREYDAQSLTLSADDCAALDRARESLFTAIKKACLRKDKAYDVIFRGDVLTQPFVKEALGK